MLIYFGLYCELSPCVQFLKGSGLTVRPLKPRSNRHLVLLIKSFKSLKMIPKYKKQQQMFICGFKMLAFLKKSCT